MSPDFYRNQIQTAQRTVASLQRDKSRELGRISDFQKKIGSATHAAAKATSTSTSLSKQREVERLNRDIASAQKQIAGIEDRISRETTKIGKAQQDLAKEESRITLKLAKEADKRHLESTRHVSNLTSQVKLQNQQLQKLLQPPAEIRILFIAANPLDQSPLRLDEEAREIESLIRSSAHRDSIHFHSHWAARPLDLIQKLNEIKPTILHISGHGSDQDELVFQDDQGETKLVSKDAFVQTLAATTGSLQLIVLNNCHSSPQAEAATQHIAAAIGMRDEITDPAARIFASRLYSAIGFGLDLDKAFRQAKAALMLEGIPEENTPVLFTIRNQPPEEIILVRSSIPQQPTFRGEL
jgi:hypothetical protein